MQLLVSVRSAEEAFVALDAGARILDAKEPALGALAPVAPAELAAIASLLPAGVALSVALGEPTDPGAFDALLEQRSATLGARAAFLKFVPPAMDIEALAPFVSRARSAAPAARVIVAGYADRMPERGPRELVRAASVAGADGVLLDTSGKQASLFANVPEVELATLLATAHAHGLLLGLAGGLGLDEIARLAALGADVAGVRGAACDDLREGRISATRVRALVEAARSTRREPAAPVA